MIKNIRQYQVTQKRLEEFSASLESLEGNQDMDMEEKKIYAEPIQGEIEILRADLDEYDKLKARALDKLKIKSLQDISDVLIKTRLFHDWNQADLAERLGMKEQQIQRYESTDYESASFARIVEIAEVLELEMKACFYLPEPKVELTQQEFLLPAGIDYPALSKCVHDRCSLIELQL